jgi:precorrin-4 methylase
VIVLITFVITSLVFLCGVLVYKISLVRKEEMNQRRQVQKLANHLDSARWVINHLYEEDLDQLVSDNTPFTR